MKRRFWVWGILAGLIGCMLLVMLWITMIALRTDRDGRAMELNSEQDRTISIALWRADSFLAPIVSKYAAMPIEAFTSEKTFLLPRYIPVTDDGFVRSRFHLPQDHGRLEANDTLQTSGQPDRKLLELATVTIADWPSLYEQLPKEKQPTLDELFALNKPGNALNIGLRQNSYYAGNTSKASNSENDLQPRNFALQYAQANTKQVQQIPTNSPESSTNVPSLRTNQGQDAGFTIGISKPIWYQDGLLIARTVRSSNQIAIQGIELDWPAVRAELANQIQDLFLAADFQPITNTEAGEHLLAALPARLVLPPLTDDGFRWSPLMIAVAGGWAVMLVMSGGLVAICLSSLRFADKRSSFVNSVTHELRTPLTTFKMYSELLSRGMVDEESKQTYLQTLCSESNRLCHLIDNVLTYARLENGGETKRIEVLSIQQVMNRVLPRLTERAALDSMRLDVRIDEKYSGESLTVDASSFEQILFNLVDNASKYASQSEERNIQLVLSRNPNEWSFRVIDSGPGISSNQRATLFRPFSKSSEEAANSKPGVGLGLSLSARLAKQLNGQLKHIPTTSGCTMELLLPIVARHSVP